MCAHVCGVHMCVCVCTFIKTTSKLAQGAGLLSSTLLARRIDTRTAKQGHTMNIVSEIFTCISIGVPKQVVPPNGQAVHTVFSLSVLDTQNISVYILFWHVFPNKARACRRQQGD